MKNTSQNEIICDDIVKVYDSDNVKTTALRGLTYNFYSGKIYLILGPSGSGKTTFLNLVGGLDKASSGEIKVYGKSISNYSIDKLEDYRLTQISFILQEPIFISYLTVEENIKFALASRNMTIDDNKIEEIFKMTTLERVIHHYPSNISGGEKQRLSFAIALALDNPIFLCDEPTGQLDIENKKKIADLIKMIQQKDPMKIIIIVSHDPLFIEYADEVLVIEDGIIKQNLPKEKLSYNKSQTDLENDLKRENIYRTISMLKKEIDELENPK